MPKSLSISLVRWLLPVIAIEIYLSFTVIIYFFGPWPWPTSEPLRLLVFLILAQCCLLIGFLMTYKRFRLMRGVNLRKKVICTRLLKWHARSTLLTAVLIIPTSLSRAGSAVPDILTGIVSTGFAYNQGQDSGDAYVYVEYVRIILAPFLMAFFPLSFFSWSFLSARKRYTTLALMLYWISIYVSSGTNKGLADLIITLPVFILLARYFRGGSLGITTKKILGFVMLCVVGFLFLAFFGTGQSGREGGVGLGGVFNDGTSLIKADRSSALSQSLTERQLVTYESFTRYLVQGYYALDMSLGLLDESKQTHFIGHSMFLSRKVDQINGNNYYKENSIPG